MIKLSGEKSQKIIEKLIYEKWHKYQEEEVWQVINKKDLIATARNYHLNELANDLQKDYDWYNK